MQLRHLGLSVTAMSLVLCAAATAQPVLLTTDTVIGPTDTVVVDPVSGLAVPLAGAQITVRGCVLTISGRHRVGSLALVRDAENEPAILTHAAGAMYDYSGGAGADVVYGVDLTIDGDMVIEGASGTLVSSRIDTNGRGYGPGDGPGAGGASTGLVIGAAGGGHAGRGAKAGDAPGGASYGSISAPAELGSGGGAAGVQLGGAGGGSVVLVVRGVATIHGPIFCDGTPGTGTAGSGAGGTVSINSMSIAGAGTISASGADGATGWGGGGGGRVAISSAQSSFTGEVRATGGASVYSIERGGAGTIYRATLSNPLPEVTLVGGGNGSLPAAQTLVTGLEAARSVSVAAGANVRFADLETISQPLVVEGGAAVYLPELTSVPGDIVVRGVSRLVVGNLRTIPGSLRVEGSSIFHAAPGVTTIGGDVVLSGPANQLVLPALALCNLRVGGSLTIDSRSTIFGNGLGYPNGKGVGPGVSATQSGSGGGHGGVGGASAAFAGGQAYGSVSKPRLPGSGGGSTARARGGNGGAALRLDVGGTTTINGSISCSGESAPTVNPGAGGGAGGSIVIRTPRLVGSGQILADGGGTNNPGGGGAGGRIAIFSCDRQLPLANIRAARGGGGLTGAQDGSRYFGSSSVVFSQQPNSVRTLSGREVRLVVAASSPSGVSYRWRKMTASGEYVNLGDGGRITGSGTAELIITDADCSDSGVYDCLATDSCGSYPSNDAVVVVDALADFDLSGGVDGDDVIEFFGAWDAGEESSDVNIDGSVDADDVVAFFARWDVGC
jgi:hypothetical protein